MTDDGRSRMELLNELVPVARRLTSNDPAQMAVAEFMKLQHEFEAEDILYSTLQVAFQKLRLSEAPPMAPNGCFLYDLYLKPPFKGKLYVPKRLRLIAPQNHVD